MQSSGLHPSMSNLALIVRAGIPVSRAHSAEVMRFPCASITTFMRLLQLCCELVAHLQLLASYQPHGLIRSRLCFGLGLGPISARNLSNESRHSTDMLIPAPPYLGKALSLALKHLFFAPAQILYSGVLERPCVLSISDAFSFCRHPHDLTNPARKCIPAALVSIPQSHTALHLGTRGSRFAARPTMTSLPNRNPVKSISFGMHALYQC